MRKIISFLIFGLFCYTSSFAIGDYYVNDSLYVHQPGGVNMYGGPNPKRNKVMTIPYGSKVTVVYDSFRKKSMKVEEEEDFYIKGHWVRVNFNNQFGYVFDGYLSKLPAFSLLGDHKLTKKYYTPEKHYLAFMLGRFGPQTDLTSADCGGPTDCVVGFEQGYNFKITYKEWFEEGKQYAVLEFPEFTNEEIYFLAKELYYGVQGDVIHYDKKKKIMKISPTEGQEGCPVKILMEDKYPVIEYTCTFGK